jgi:hypothetical protein
VSTTALLVEILIIGFEVGLWMLLFINLLDPKLIHCWLDQSGGNALVEAGALLAGAYVLGIMADKTAKWVVEESRLAYLFLFDPVLIPEGSPEKRWPGNEAVRTVLERLWRPDARAVQSKRPTAADRPSSYLEQYAAVVKGSQDFMSDLLYGRSKVRILRASIFILPLIALTATIAWVRSYLGFEGAQIWLAVLGGAGGLFLSVVAARYLIRLYCYNRWLYRYRLDYFSGAVACKGVPERD